MEAFTLTTQEFELITEKLSQFYINNEDSIDFLKSTYFKVPLQNYLCVCYGVDSSLNRARKVEFFRFLGVIENQQG